MKSSHLSCGLRLDLVAQLLTDTPDKSEGGLGGGIRPESGDALHELLVDAVVAAVGLRAALRLGLRQARAAPLESCGQMINLVLSFKVWETTTEIVILKKYCTRQILEGT